MGIVQNLFLAYVNTKVMKYKIHENNFDIANIWGLAHRLLQGGIGAIYFKERNVYWMSRGLDWLCTQKAQSMCDFNANL